MPTKGLAAAIAVAVAVCVLAPCALLFLLLMATTGSGSVCQTMSHGGQQDIEGRSWDAEQLTNARIITEVVLQRRLPHRAAVLAVSTAIVESRLINVHYGDRDSLGLFQQRPSQGWGSAEQVTNPVYATGTFLDHLMALPGWSTMDPGGAQQRVQRSAFPERYAPQEPAAAALVDQFWTGPRNPPLPADGPPAQQVSATGCPDLGGGGVIAAAQPGLPPGFTLPADPRQRASVEFAVAQLGKPYVYGAKGPNEFDCSGLVQAAWAHAGVPISTGTRTQRHDGSAVPGPGQLQPGDLVFIPGSLGSPSDPRHVGLYAGHGLIINAYDDTTGVVAHTVADWSPHIVAIRRVAPPAVPAPPPWGGPPA
ncbi:C40 family peptidase [Saccharopolyspora sp. K220]|uniref:C40 family peptidase n=1 Tax=Saccharopolyspora soli TaxID=2926618 RepID=UPI001F5A8798|nr:C40 family peptidase [Saccharopolyspora soli]MCI2421086.1 C40 family peptidase [Saccharopolyspora soli]